MFEYQFAELPKHGYRCIGVDSRGFGESDKPLDDYNYDTIAEDIKAILESLDLLDVTLAGFSMGRVISTRYISSYHGTHIEKLVLISSASPLIN